jgi:hypothetical protein
MRRIVDSVFYGFLEADVLIAGSNRGVLALSIFLNLTDFVECCFMTNECLSSLLDLSLSGLIYWLMLSAGYSCSYI